jgi:probable addiction module antidote protein
MSDYTDDLLTDLADPEYAALYLTAAYRESRGAFLVALKDVANAMFGMTKLAESVEANRVSLYRALSEQGNPTLSTLNSIIEALNLEVSFSPRISIAPAGAPRKTRLPGTKKTSSKFNEVLKGSQHTGTTGAIKKRG